ncbi:MAG: hypothetical protein WBB45_20420 [Cyclobacteriaceae bacterium]
MNQLARQGKISCKNPVAKEMAKEECGMAMTTSAQRENQAGELKPVWFGFS